MPRSTPSRMLHFFYALLLLIGTQSIVAYFYVAPHYRVCYILYAFLLLIGTQNNLRASYYIYAPPRTPQFRVNTNTTPLERGTAAKPIFDIFQEKVSTPLKSGG